MRERIIGIDAGGTMTKAAMFDAAGRELACERAPNRMLFPKPGHTERDAEVMWEAAAKAVSALLEGTGTAAGDVAAVSVTGYGSGIYLVDQEGRAVRPGVVSTDSRATALVEDWRRDGRAERNERRIQQRIWPGQAIALMAWLQANEPEAVAKTASVLMSTTGRTLDVVSPIEGATLTTIADGDAQDVDIAVRTARQAYDHEGWSRAAPLQRKKVLLRFADLIEKHAVEIAVLGVRDNGTEISMAYKAEPLSAAGTIRYYAEAIDKVYGEIAPTSHDILGLVHREPLGVVGVIVPWNFPLMIGAWKIGPALAAGNCVVVKPPEIASLTLLRLAELASEAGLPDGVLNVVTGRGAMAGEALASHMDVDALAFTGSGPVGRSLLQSSARSNMKRVHLELGGKSPNVVFADAPDLKQAAKVSAAGIFRNSGQVCVAGSRLLVQASIYDRFVSEMLDSTEKLKVGNPLDLASDIGAVSNEAQLTKNLAAVARASGEGATLLTGGDRLHAETGGYYMSPTIFADVTPAMDLWREEVFGPVLAVTRFDDLEEAVRLANATPYGLASAVWTGSLSTAHRMVRAIDAGVVHVNTYGGTDITVPLGGFKQSGFGRDKSLHAFDAYTDLKTAWISL